jgi:hypothetical protein
MLVELKHEKVDHKLFYFYHMQFYVSKKAPTLCGNIKQTKQD